MKVKLDQTVEVTEQQREEIAHLIDDSRKRKCTRIEAREFIWKHGASWESMLDHAEEYEEDLIGDFDSELESII